jgi:nucleoside-diphosphate-sugar epimerase
MRYLVTGGAGFIGSHMVDRLVKDGHQVVVLDNLISGSMENLDPNSGVTFVRGDIQDIQTVHDAMVGCDGVFHFAAIARTPWTIEDPILCMATNVMGTTVVLEVARKLKIARVVLSSSCIVYAAPTPYKVSKLALERLADSFNKMYGMSIIALRYSNVYGSRQSEEGISPNLFAALRKHKREKGYLEITGDGEQTREFTHVSDIVEGNLLAMQSTWCGELDLTTGVNTTLNQVAEYFDCPVEYVGNRHGDVRHIIQDPGPAKEILGWEAKVALKDGIVDAL